MIRTFCLAAMPVLLLNAQAPALTMTPTSDNRSITANAQAGPDSDSNSDAPGAGFPTFDSNVFAEAGGFDGADNDSFQNGIYDFGPSASAEASQDSSVGSLSIVGDGWAHASGNHGLFPELFSTSDAEHVGPGSFEADAESLLEVIFSIDQSAQFSLKGFVGAGDELAVGIAFSDQDSFVLVELVNTDTNSSVFNTTVRDDEVALNEDGIIGPGNYRFTVQAFAEVFGSGQFPSISALQLGDSDNGNGIYPEYGYATFAGFEDVELALRPTDQPIPEPVTTTLAGLGLTALMFQTTRRRRHA
ncbi:MAG: hypothetical protein Kow00105_11740 [Phycisphaeraceae bacterium]